MKLHEFLTEKESKTTLKIGFDFRLAVPVASTFHAGLSSKSSFEETVKDIAESFASVADGVTVKTRTKPGPRAKGKQWFIEPSTSSSKSGAHTIEIISPIMHPTMAKQKMTAVADWIDANDLRTDDTDYLRVAFHVDEMNNKLDPVKLVMFLDGTDSDGIFKKVLPRVSPSELEILMHKIKQNGKLPLQAVALHRAALTYLGNRPDGNTNFGNALENIIEFRVASGAGYHYNVNNAIKKVTRLSRALEVATDPNSLKSDYMKRIRELFSHAKTPVAEVRDAPPALSSLQDQDPEIARAWKLYNHDADFGDAKAPLLILINRIMKASRKRKDSLSTQEKTFVKSLLRDSRMTEEDVDQYYGHDKLARVKFKKDFAL